MERRAFTTKLEVRQDEGTPVLTGYAAKFNRESQMLGWFIEVIAPGCFAKSIQEADVRALFNHEPNFVLGRNKSGTLRLEEDGTGLMYEVDPDLENSDHRNVVRMIERGDVNQSSFGFEVVKDEWDYSDPDRIVRTLKEVKLYDVSPVTYPAYLDTEVDVKRAMRSFSVAAKRSLEEIEEAVEAKDLRSILTKTEPPPADTPPPSDPEPETPESPAAEARTSLYIARKRLELIEVLSK